ALERFLEACGATGPLRLVIESPGKQLSVTRAYPQPYVLIGRDPRADLFLDDVQVSHRHAYLQVVAGQVLCTDLSSRTGTHWPHGPEHFGWLEDVQGGVIGPFRVRLVREPGTESSAEQPVIPSVPPAPVGQPPLPDVRLEWRQPGGRRAAWQMA